MVEQASREHFYPDPDRQTLNLIAKDDLDMFELELLDKF